MMLKRADKKDPASIQAFTGLGYTSIYRLENKGEFPKRRQLSPGRVAWVKAEVEAWLASRITVLPALVAVA